MGIGGILRKISVSCIYASGGSDERKRFPSGAAYLAPIDSAIEDRNINSKRLCSTCCKIGD